MEQPNYYSITPAEVRYDKELKPNEKLMYGEITALSNRYGYCTASNQYFAELYGVSKETVSRWIGHLNSKGYIKVEVIRAVDKTVQQRRIYVSERGEVLTKKSIPSCQKDQDPIDEKIKENITSNNNTSINITSNSSSSYSPSQYHQKVSVDNSAREAEEKRISLITVRRIATINDFGNKNTLPTASEWRNIERLSDKLSGNQLSNLVLDFREQMETGLIEQPFRYFLKMLRERVQN